MVRAIRAVSVERGYDPRQFTLVAFGGAGPLHACEVAEEIGIRQVLFPPSPGTLCSLGLLMADTQFDLSRSRLTIVNEQNLSIINNLLADLALEGQQLLNTQKYQNCAGVSSLVSIAGTNTKIMSSQLALIRKA